LLSHPDLLVLSVLALLAVLAVLLNLHPVVRLSLALPLVLVAPGHVLISALLPDRPLGPIERTLVAVAGSIVVTILLGLVMAGIGIPLNPATWTAGLAIFTVAGAAIAWYRMRRSRRPSTFDDVPVMRARDAIPMLLALVGVIAIVVGTRVIAAGNEAGVPEQLWLLPADDGSLNARLGMRASDEGGSYLIRLTSAGEELEEFSLPNMQPGQVWQQVVIFDAEDRDQPIVGRLYAEGSDTELRFVVLQSPVATPVASAPS
jgi:hypothetical protein